jgi:phosphodiesterase/alkaline phosphatase D-like protein
VAEAEPGPPSARDTTVVDPLSRRVDHGAVPSRPRDPLNPRLFGRRAFLRGALAATLAGPSLTGCATPARPEVAGRDPFSLGVASGEPTPDGFVLWTRLAPVPLWSDPAAPGGLVPNPVVIGGDLHSFWVNDLKRDFDDPGSPTVATEFIGTSVSSIGPSYSQFSAWLPDNQHVRFFESRQRGYVSVELTAERLTAYLRTVSDAHDPRGTLSTLRSFVVESGRPGPCPRSAARRRGSSAPTRRSTPG